jgi:DNA polymerase
MEWPELVRELERTLRHLERAGVRYLNVPPAPQMPPAPAAAPAARPVRRLFSRVEQPPPVPGPAAPPAPEASSPGGGGADDAGSLESLYMQYRDCLACRLGPGRNRFVFGTGNFHPRLLFIGEGPGAEEDQQGLPFVGRAGQLLTGLIHALGLVREDVYITNVVKCRPPGNRNPEPDEIAACRPILKRQIELLDPALIVTLGNVPLKALNPQAQGITKERGRVFQYERWRVFPTFHPSFLLRSPDAIAECWADMRRAFALAYGGAPPPVPPRG